MDLLVGDDGRIWNPYSYDFMRHIGYFGGDHDLTSYAIRNLGFAMVRHHPRYSLIRLRPSLFPMACLKRVIEILIYNDTKRVVLEKVGQSFSPIEVVGNFNDALARLRVLQESTPDEGAQAAPNIIPLALERLDHPKRASMRAALSAWQAEQGYTTADDAHVVANDPVYGGGGMVWLPGNDRCIVHAWPKTYRKYDDGAQEQRFLGWDVTDLPDARYIVPATRAYFTAAHSQAPRLELIEALATLHDGSRFWTRYERLVLPWRTRSKDTFVSAVPLFRAVRPC